MRIPVKKLYQVIKDLHYYIGLFISPFIVIFSVSVLVLNHNFVDWQDDWQEWFFSANEKVDRTAEFSVPDADKNEIDFAKDILNQLRIRGEIAGIFGDSIEMYIPVTLPGRRISIKADLKSGMAYIHSEQTSLWKKLVWLHKMPGPHNANIRGNWVYTKIWASLADLFVICLLISSVAGIVLWYHIKEERILGLIALFIGFISIVLLIIGLTN